LSATTDLFAAAAALGAARWWYPRAVERMTAARLPLGPDGIIRGAGPLARDGSDPARAVLVLHGFGDTPESVRPLVDALAARGWTVRAPLLAGHGRTLREFARSSGDEWLASAREALRAMTAAAPRVMLTGQSLGGALAAILAAERSDVAALALLAPYFEAPGYVRGFARLAPVLSPVIPYLVTVDQRSLMDPEARARSLSFGATTPRLTRELVRIADHGRAAFPAVRAPVLYLQSPEDNRVAPGVAERACASRPGTVLEWIEGSGHVLTADVKREQVAARVGAWFERYAGAR